MKADTALARQAYAGAPIELVIAAGAARFVFTIDRLQAGSMAERLVHFLWVQKAPPMPDFFAAAVAIVLPEEGPYALERGDPGGETKWGIARNEHPEISASAWAAFTRADALAICRRRYWLQHHCDMMPWRWALAVFDGAVNQGDAVIALAQEALGLAQRDGVVGGLTLGAIGIVGDEPFETFLALRAQAYTRDRGWPSDGKGWMKRLFNVALHAAVVPAA